MELHQLHLINSPCCKSEGGLCFDCFIKRNHQNTPTKICVKNLPKGITKTGIRNLFLSIAEPISIDFLPQKSQAFVGFKSLNEAELAVVKLNNQPPFNLKIFTLTLSHENYKKMKCKSMKIKEDFFIHDIATDKLDKNSTDSLELQKSDKVEKLRNQIKSICKFLSYDPSIRMRQKILDFKTPTYCISLGRGFMNMGEDRTIGGLQTFVSISDNYDTKDEVDTLCDHCGSVTRKICSNCLVPYCSKFCLTNSGLNHRRGLCKDRSLDPFEYWSNMNWIQNINEIPVKEFSTCEKDKNVVPLKPCCNVVMSMYNTLETVFVRRIGKPWEEKFVRCCNDVSIESYSVSELKTIPTVGEFYSAKYYEDNCYYRAKVIAVEKEFINVFFVDFGNTQKTKLRDLKLLSEKLQKVHWFAVEVKLKDIPEGSSLEAIEYYNKLVSESIPLILKYDNSVSDGVVLVEEDSGEVVNKVVAEYASPSWKIDPTVLLKSGGVLCMQVVKTEELEIGKKYNLKLSHFDEKELSETESFWMVVVDTDRYIHVNNEMKLRITEYCEYLANDLYLPRISELCLALNKNEWHRCVCIDVEGTTCTLFFVDEGYTSMIKTTHIRKMIKDFIEIPLQAIRCSLPGHLKTNAGFQSKIVKFFKKRVGTIFQSVSVTQVKEDINYLQISEIEELKKVTEVVTAIKKEEDKK